MNLGEKNHKAINLGFKPGRPGLLVGYLYCFFIISFSLQLIIYSLEQTNLFFEYFCQKFSFRVLLSFCLFFAGFSLVMFMKVLLKYLEAVNLQNIYCFCRVLHIHCIPRQVIIHCKPLGKIPHCHQKRLRFVFSTVSRRFSGILFS